MSKDKLSTQEFADVMEFANALYGYNNGIYNPYSQNELNMRIGGLKKKPTIKELYTALDEANATKQLSEWSDFMATFDNIYKRTIDYYCSLLDFNLTWVCTNYDKNCKGYQQDQKRLMKFFNGFDYKREFKNILRKMLTRDVYYTYLRSNTSLSMPLDLEGKTEKFSIQTMPQDHCKLTGQFEGGLLYDVDLSYFINTQVDIKAFPPIFSTYLKDIYTKGGELVAYNPTSPLSSHRGRYGAMWRQTTPIDGAWVFKFSNGFGIEPPLMSLMKSCLTNDEIEKLQHDKDMISAYYLLTGSIETNDKAEIKDKDALKLTPNTLGMFMNLVQKSVEKTMKPIAMPLSEIRGYQFNESNPNMVSNHLKEVVGQAASAGELIYHNENLSQFAMQNAIETDYEFIKNVYAQFEAFLNFFVNRKMVKYQFRFKLDGLARTWAREAHNTELLKIADKGFVLPPQFYASIAGVDAIDFVQALEQARDSKYVDKLIMLPNANTMSGDENANGRPKKEGLDKSDKTEEVQESVD